MKFSTVFLTLSAPVLVFSAPTTISGVCWLASGAKGVCAVSTAESACPDGTLYPTEPFSGVYDPWPCGGDETIQCCVPKSDNNHPTTPTSTDSPNPSPSPSSPSSSTSQKGDGHMCEAGIKMLKELEGVVLHVYLDQRGVPTIGIGRNCQVAVEPCPPTISEEQAEQYLHEDLVKFEQKVCQLPNADKLNRNQFSALVSYAFNVGEFGAWDDLYPYMANKDFDGLGKNLVNMRPIDGRRKHEQDLYFTPTQVTSGCSPASA